MKAQDPQSKIYTLAVHGVICACLFAAVLILQYYYPVAYAYWGMEDLWGEYATFVCFLLAGVLIAWAIRIDRRYRCPGYVALCLGLFFVAMEEVSWGQRLFGLPTPYFLGQHNYQAELTVHNFYVFRSTRLDIFYYAIAFWVFLLPVFSRCSLPLKILLNKIGMPSVPYTFMPYFALSIFVFKLGFLLNSQEISEQFLGIGFLLYAVDVVHQAYEPTARSFWEKKNLSSIILAAGVLLTLFFVKIKPTEPRLKSFFLHQFASRHFPETEMNAQAKAVFRYLMLNEEMKADETMLQYGMFLQSIQDPGSESVLLKALEEQKERARLQPGQSGPHHLAGKILALLGRHDSAKQEFEAAIMADRNNLPHAASNWEKVNALKSIAQNYLEMDEKALALQELQKADGIVNDAWQTQEIRDLMKKINNE
jgi:tetratricopeptide (TPR) repeat protein